MVVMQDLQGGLLELSVDSDLKPPDHPEGFDPKHHAWLSGIELALLMGPDRALNTGKMGQGCSADALTIGQTGSSDSS
jgi:hypothetical protein